MNIEEYEKNYRFENDYWWFVGVRSFVHSFISKYLPQNKLRILDVGCGTGGLLEELENKGHATYGVDISSEAVSFCQARGLKNVFIGDALKLPFENESFDLVCAIGVVEHIENDAQFLQELRRVLKNKGKIILLTSSFPFLWSEHDVANHHVRRYYLRNFSKLCEKQGFKKLALTHIVFFLFLGIAPLLLLNNLQMKLLKFLNCKHKEERLIGNLPLWVNKFLSKILKIEEILSGQVGTLPWGISMMGCFEKDTVAEV